MKTLELIVFWILFLPFLVIIIALFWIEELININRDDDSSNIHNKPMGGE